MNTQSYNSRLLTMALAMLLFSVSVWSQNTSDNSSLRQDFDGLVLPDHSWTGMQFGWDVAAEDDTLVVSNFGTAITASVYVFKRINHQWQQTQRIIQPSNSEDFAITFDLFKDRMIVSAPDYRFQAHKNRGSAPGAAYIYEFDGAMWEQTGLVFAEDESNFNEEFGYRVKIYGDTAIVSAPEDDDGMYESYGAVYVFTKGVDGWSQSKKIILPIRRVDEFFGVEIDLGVTSPEKLNGDRIVIGTLKSEAVYIFELINEDWILVDQLFANDYGSQSGWGRSLSIQDDLLVVGSPLEEKGVVNVFKKMDDTWTHQETFTNLIDDGSLYFGNRVTLHNNKILVSYLMDPGSINDNGQNFLYQFNGIEWIRTHAFNTELSNFNFGQALTDDWVFLGTPKTNRHPNTVTGVVYAISIDNLFCSGFEISPDACK